MSSQLLEESKRMGKESTTEMVSKVRIEVEDQFDAIMKLQGFRDLAQIINDIVLEQDIEKLKGDNKKFLELTLQTVRIIDLVVGAYERLDKVYVMQQMVQLGPVLMHCHVNMRPKPSLGSPPFRPDKGTTVAAKEERQTQEERIQDGTRQEESSSRKIKRIVKKLMCYAKSSILIQSAANLR